jgi:hypothetical protein
MIARKRLPRFATAVPKWPRERLADRLLTCIAMLSIHGLMTDTEKAKVKQRLERAILESAKERP